ncbi:MAG: hypothetical protein COA43_14250 [Robiginitomaculum sp.]|nr:MAG: hypothetical protein COA43_14250 [Robiginitomaculum sp.]
MPFAPVIPLSGVGGWNFLQRTQERQEALFNKSPDIQREIEYFKENIGNITSSADLVADRRLLSVALGAFGLSDEVYKRAYVRTVIDGGTEETGSFANRLNNTQYINFAEFFSFGNEGGFEITEAGTDEIVEKFLAREFEESVGDVDDTMRQALWFKREMGELSTSDYSRTTGWLKALGSLPVRAVLESAFNLPTEFSQIDLDRQVEILVDKAKLLFGSDSIDIFSDPDKMDDVLRRFHLREQINAGPSATTPGYTALALLGGTGNGFGAAGILNILLSNASN